MSKTDFTAEYVRHLLDYDAETGVFTWRNPNTHLVKPGGIAGSRGPKGSWAISIDNKKHLAHRLAWLYVYGEHPPGQIDHIDRDRLNNRISNLRLATPSQNRQNIAKPNKNSTSGYLGVFRHGQGWIAQIKVSGKLKRLGKYVDPESASAAYWRAKRELHEFCPKLA